jgi:putative flavoprotein involved in K+ transport
VPVEPLVIVGAGWAGLCAAAAAREEGLDPLVVDAAPGPGGLWREADPTMACLSPRRWDALPDGATPSGGQVAHAGQVRRALEEYAERSGFRTRYGARIATCARTPRGFTLVGPTGPIEARRLIAATGIAGAPRRDLPGAATAIPALDLHRRVHGLGRRVLVVGSGNSGADAVRILLAAGRSVILASRSPLRSQRPYPPGVRGEALWRLSALPVGLLPRFLRCRDPLLPLDDALAEAVAAGAITLRGEALSLHAGGALCRRAPGSAERVDTAADAVVLATGYRRDLHWLGAVAPRDAAGVPLHRGGVVPAAPGLGLLGLDCQRTRRSGFLRGMAQDARAVVRALLGAGS